MNVDYEEVTKKVKYGECRHCRFNAKLARFKLINVEETLGEGGRINRKKQWDGTYRCPMCGTADPHEFIETITEYVQVERA